MSNATEENEKCPNCLGGVSDQAKKCRHCGSALPVFGSATPSFTAKVKNWGCFAIIVAFLLANWMIGTMFGLR